MHLKQSREIDGLYAYIKPCVLGGCKAWSGEASNCCHKNDLILHFCNCVDISSHPCLLTCSPSTRCLLCRLTEEERRGTSEFGSNLLLKSPLPSSSSQSPSAELCLRRGAATYLAPFVITRGTLNLMPLRIRRSLSLLRRPSTLPRLRLKTAAHSPLLLKR